MQDIDRPADIEALPQPARARRPRVETQSLRVVPRAKRSHRIRPYRGRRRDLGEGPTVRPSEAERAVGLVIHLVTLLVDRAMVPATQERRLPGEQ
jgi:hypothetical protein